MLPGVQIVRATPSADALEKSVDLAGGLTRTLVPAILDSMRFPRVDVQGNARIQINRHRSPCAERFGWNFKEPPRQRG